MPRQSHMFQSFEEIDAAVLAVAPTPDQKDAILDPLRPYIDASEDGPAILYFVTNCLRRYQFEFIMREAAFPRLAMHAEWMRAVEAARTLVGVFDSPAARLALSIGCVPSHIAKMPRSPRRTLAAILAAAEIEKQQIEMLHTLASLIEQRVDAAKRALPLSRGGQPADVLVCELVEQLALIFHLAARIAPTASDNGPFVGFLDAALDVLIDPPHVSRRQLANALKQYRASNWA